MLEDTADFFLDIEKLDARVVIHRIHRPRALLFDDAILVGFAFLCLRGDAAQQDDHIEKKMPWHDVSPECTMYLVRRSSYIGAKAMSTNIFVLSARQISSPLGAQ